MTATNFRLSVINAWENLTEKQKAWIGTRHKTFTENIIAVIDGSDGLIIKKIQKTLTSEQRNYLAMNHPELYSWVFRIRAWQ